MQEELALGVACQRHYQGLVFLVDLLLLEQ